MTPRAGDQAKREGDGKSPAGVFALSSAFGYAPQPLRGSRMPYLNLTSSTECVDDVHSKYYNRIVDRSLVTPDWNSSEHMRDAGESYRWGIIVDHNRIVAGDNNPPEPAGGSCVFLHIWHDMIKVRSDALPCHKATWQPCSSGSIRCATHCWYNYPTRPMSSSSIIGCYRN